MVSNRWAEPTFDEVEYRADALPLFLERVDVASKMRELRSHIHGIAALVVVGTDPMLHRVDEGDGTPAVLWWRASCVFLDAKPGSTIYTGLRLTSCAMHQDGDQQDTVREEFVDRCVKFATKLKDRPHA
jgi:hypothetical protein